jgi:hypothetical protein
MNVSPGSAFFQTVQGSAASSGAHSPDRAVARPVQEASAATGPVNRQRDANFDGQMPQQLRQGPPGTNLNIVI